MKDQILGSRHHVRWFGARVVSWSDVDDRSAGSHNFETVRERLRVVSLSEFRVCETQRWVCAATKLVQRSTS